MRVTPTELRKNIYALLDRVIETGEPLEIDRKGVTLEVVAPKPSSKLSKLEAAKSRAKEIWVGDPNDIFTIDLLEEWREEWGLTKEDLEVRD
jgi:antitoxin (DNA-binding transcriptional repressor) of toxin-antitoxin stability system